MNPKYAAALLGLAILAAGGWLMLALPAGRALVMTPFVFLNIMIQTGEWRPLEVLTKAPRMETEVLESPNGRKLALRLWIPRPLPSLRPGSRFPAALIYTPFIGGGLEDPRLVNLAETFSRAGIVSLAFWRESDPLVASEKDVADVVAAFQFLLRHPQVRPHAVGLIGISYGNGPVIIAAADPAIRDDVSFILSHAGYYDLENVLRFIVTGEYAYGEIRGRIEPNRYGHEILSRTLKQLGVDDATAKDFTESPGDFDENLTGLPQLQELARSLSPSRAVGEIQARRIYIIHATDDTFIPYTESERLRDALVGRVPVQFQLIDVFEHGTPRPPTFENLRRYWLPNFANVIAFLYTLLKETYSL